jgi:chromodomain-helicase-DNA-binding protein 7
MQKEGVKLETDVTFERPEDILRTDKNEIIVKLEKGEGTLKIEKIGVKKEVKVENTGQIKRETDTPFREEKDEVELTLVKSGIKSEHENLQAEDQNESAGAETVKKPANEKDREIKEERVEKAGSVADKDKQCVCTDTGQEVGGEEDRGGEYTGLKEELIKESSIGNKDDRTVIEAHDESPGTQEESQQEQKADDEEAQNEVIPETDNNSGQGCPKLEGETEGKMEVEPNQLLDEIVETEKNVEEDQCGHSEVMKNEVEKTNKKDRLEEDGKEAGCEESTAVEVSESREPAETSNLDEKSRVQSCESDVVSENSLKGEESLDAVPVTTKKVTSCSNNTQAAELKAMFPDLEVIQPLSQLAEVDSYLLAGKQPSINSGEVLDFSEPTVAQLLAQSYQNPIKWPKVRSANC